MIIVNLQTLANPYFVSGCNKLGQYKLPMKMAYALGKMLKVAQEALNSFEAAKQSALQRLGQPIADKPGQYTITPGTESFDKFSVELNELLVEKVKLYFSGKLILTGDELPPLNAFELMALEDIVEIGDSEPIKADDSGQDKDKVVDVSFAKAQKI
jgi:hypothetical protein